MSQETQPRGLYLLLFTELWERFSFYTLQTILILYMTQGMLLSDTKAYLLYGTFSALLYFTPVLGGYLADKYFGFQKAIILGAILFIVGYLLLAVSSSSFFLALSILILASGLFKPSVSSIVGDLYRGNDPRREGGFTLFYMGTHLGSLVPPLITGTLVLKYGWHSGFLLAAIAMAIGLTVFLTSKSRLRAVGGLPMMSPLHRPKETIRFYTLFLGGIAGSLLFLLFLFQFPVETDILLTLASLAILFVVIYPLLKERAVRRSKMIGCLVLILISVGFWAIYSQTFTSLMLYADRNMGKEFLGFTIDAEFTQFFNPFFIVLLSPLFSWLWTFLSKKKSNLSIPAKFSWGVLFMALGFFLLGYGGAYFGREGGISPYWLAGSYLLQTIGELLLFPIGLAMITTLSPPDKVGMMKGVWFLTQAAAFAIGGGLATLSVVPSHTASISALAIYDRAFFIYGGLALALAVLSFALLPKLKHLIYGPDRVGVLR